MGRPRLRDPARSVTTEELDEFERELKAQLPPQYRAFLMRSNGGKPSPRRVRFPDRPDRGTQVQIFYGLNVDTATPPDLREEVEDTRSELPGELIPIAIDAGANLIALAVAGEHFGEVYFCDHEGLWTEEEEQELGSNLAPLTVDGSDPGPPTPWGSGIWQLARDFDAFLDQFGEKPK